jgi:predicted O-linked N-acetylglucosamine transferase (SPINDLY family)
LRLGYLSGDYKKHPIACLLSPVLEAHDKNCFELVAFDNSRSDGSAERTRILAAFDEVIPVRKMSDEELARTVVQARIDLLIDLSGRTTDSRSEVLAYRPAPVQITWLGFPGGLGGDLADYLIADAITVPIGSERDFDEALIRLPVCYLPCGDKPSSGEPPSRALQGLPGAGLVFACFNQHAKITAETFDRWCELLRRTPGSVLWLKGESKANNKRLQELASERGVAPARVLISSRETRNRHIQRLACADLILDCHPYTMHTTAVDALAAGVPYLTFTGETLASRVSSSLLHTAGLGDCVCRDADHYLERMLALAGNTAELGLLRQRFRAARTESRLFDSQAFARDLESACEQAFERWFKGQAPAAITIQGVRPNTCRP